MTTETTFQAIFDIERPQHEVWQNVSCATEHADIVRIPGFPSSDGAFGAPARRVNSSPQQRLVCRKLDAPAEGSEITITLDPANASGWPTRVKLSQRGPQALLTNDDAAKARWSEIVADFRLFLEQDIEAPVDRERDVVRRFGIDARETPTFLEILDVRADSIADLLGLKRRDALLIIGTRRLFDIRQLWTLLATIDPGEPIKAQVIREDELIELAGTM